MKKFLFVFGIVILVTESAYAAFQKQWVFKCQYTGELNETCEVLANACRYNLYTPLENLPDSANIPLPPAGCKDWLVVKCGGKKLLEAPAAHTTTSTNLPHTTLNFEALIANSNTGSIKSAMMRYSSQEAGEANPFYISSWLQSGNYELRGYCVVYQPQRNSTE